LLTLNIEIEKHINKLVNPLKEGDELTEALKLKLTKKELKLLKAWAEGSDIETLKKQLNLDDERYGELSSKLIKKLNQEKTKQAICI
jgi:chaperonin cofactor prefoldin